MPDFLFGWWKSDGYGYLIHLDQKKNRFFQLSDQFCIEEDIGDEKLHDFYPRYRINKTKNQVDLFGSHDPYPYRYKRLNQPPESCAQKLPNTPINNFDVFVDIFSTHYAFFDLYEVDWGTRAEEFRPSVNNQTTDQELFEIFEQMLVGINDGHINIKASIEGTNKRYHGYPGKIEAALNKYAKDHNIDLNEASNKFHNHYWLKEIPEQILANNGHFIGNKRIQYGLIEMSDKEPPIGYLALVSVANFLKQDDELKTLSDALDHALNQSINLFTENKVSAVIIDLSINYGGYDFISRKIAERFNNKNTPSYTKYANDASEPIRHRYELKVGSEPRYTGPVYVLTSNITLSGAETLTLGLKSLPNVTHVGESTRGALSDRLEKNLPNGWELSLSNEVYIDHQGNAWEGIGVPPDVAFPVFDWDKPMSGHITAVNKLIALIQNTLTTDYQ